MIIFGSRMYGKKNTVKGCGHCNSCGKYGKHISYNGRKWGHLYFIPLIPMGARVRVVKECKKCSHGMHVPEEDVAAMLDDICQNCDNALAALMAGQEAFYDDGTPIACIAYLKEAIEMLCCLCEEGYVRSALEALQKEDLTYAYNLINGGLLEFQGMLEEAAVSYRQAVECEPAEALPLISLGAVHLKGNDYEGARPIYEKALELSEEKLPVLQILIKVYSVLKDNVNLSKTYEECFRLVPKLAENKKVAKVYKKACKKIGKHAGQ